MKQAIKAFVRATGFGALAGGAPYILFTVPVSLSGLGDVPAHDLLMVPFVAASPVLYAGGFTLAGMLLIGLPLTLLFARLRCEMVENYRMVGGLAGFLLPLIFFSFSVVNVGGLALFFAVPGALAGYVSASVWGGWRESVASAASEVRETIAYDRGERWLR